MFRSFTRLPLRRCLHTVPPRPTPSQGSNISLVLGLGATIAAVTYFSSGQRIALDSEPVTAYKKPHTVAHTSQTPSETLTSKPSSSSSNPPEPTHSDAVTEPTAIADAVADSEDSEEDDGSSGGAFNPVTGEINWDCPCLGGMAHGVCGPQFREAFSCFVHSEDEPKGIDCVGKFKNMQDCFREHPDLYGAEIMDDEDEDEEGAGTLDTSGTSVEGTESAEGAAIITNTAQDVSQTPSS